MYKNKYFVNNEKLNVEINRLCFDVKNLYINIKILIKF